MRSGFGIARKVLLIATALLQGCNTSNSESLLTDEPSDFPRLEDTVRPTTNGTLSGTDIPDDPRQTLAYLASDALEGRGIDTPGLDRAADFIAERFRRMGLSPPVSSDAYFQPFSLKTTARIDPDTKLTIGQDVCRLRDDFVPLAFSANKEISGEVHFVGYGITRPEKQYDDYDGLDVRGKIVMMMRFEPHADSGRSRLADEGWSNDATLPAKVRNAVSHGASGVLFVNPPTHHGEDALVPFVQQSGIAQSEIPLLHIKQELANRLLRAADLPDLKTLQQTIDTSFKPASQLLQDSHVVGRVTITQRQVAVKNVIALLPGRGPLAGEYVVIGAHYDHWGRGGHGAFPATRPGDEIYNGADDNASGTAALLALARQFARLGPQERTLVFVAFTAEERGLVGSGRFISDPPVPLEKIVAMINLDMVGRMRDQTVYVMGTGTAAPFQSIVEKAADGLQLKVNTKSQGGLGPSDHMSFAMKRIPVLFFFTGVHSDYHRPSDEADRINHEGLEKVINLVARIVQDVVKMPRPAYVATFDARGSFFGGSGSGVLLGVMPEYGGAASVSGVKISGTLTGSPAEKAGLQAGDVIVKFGDVAIASLEDLSQSLATAKPDDQVMIGVNRDGQTITLKVVLAARSGG